MRVPLADMSSDSQLSGTDPWRRRYKPRKVGSMGSAGQQGQPPGGDVTRRREARLTEVAVAGHKGKVAETENEPRVYSRMRLRKTSEGKERDEMAVCWEGRKEGRGKTRCGGGDGSEEAMAHQRMKSVKKKGMNTNQQRKHKWGNVGRKISD